MNLSTLKIEEELNKYLEEAYPALYKEYILFTIVMMIACVIIPMFIIRILGKYERRVAETQGKPCKIYLFRSTAKLSVHYTVILFLPILAVRRMYYSIQLEKKYNFWGKSLGWFSLLLILFTLIAVAHLFKFRSRGLIETGIVFFLGAVYKHCIWLRVAQIIIGDVTDLRAAVRYGYYIMTDSMFTRSMGADVIAFGAIIFLTVYYYKRRFLFTPEKLHMPKCVYCGKPVIKGDSFCTCCGTGVSVETEERLIKPLDEVKHCRKCGNVANDAGCVKCDTQDYLEKFIKNKSREKWISIARGVILVTLFFVLLLIPLLDNETRKLSKGSTQVNDVFVDCWQEFDEQPNIAKDSVWLARFDADLNALYTIDSRWYYVKPRMILSDRLWFYTLYAEASYLQMEVLEEISEFVHDVAQNQPIDNTFSDREAELTAKFNSTIMAKQKAGITYVDVTSPWGILGQLEYFCYDGLNYYLHGISVTYISVFIMSVCMVMFTYLLNSFSNTTETKLERWSRKNSVRAEEYIRRHDVVYQTVISASVFQRIFMVMKWFGHSFVRVIIESWMLFVRLVCVIGLFFSLFRVKTIKRCVRWVRNGLTDDKPLRIVGEGDHIAYKRAERKMWKEAIVISMVVLGVSFAIAFAHYYRKPNQKEQYLQLAEEAVNGYCMDIFAALTHIEDTRELADEEREQIYRLFDKQIEADRRILDYDMSELGEFQNLHAGLCGLCEDEIKAIESIREYLENDFVPPREVERNYANLRKENYSWVLEELAQENLKVSIGVFLDL